MALTFCDSIETDLFIWEWKKVNIIPIQGKMVDETLKTILLFPCFPYVKKWLKNEHIKKKRYMFYLLTDQSHQISLGSNVVHLCEPTFTQPA